MKKIKMSLVEYLYVDEDRLNSYFEQISSPIAYDKVPVWKAGLSLAGPNAEGQQARFARPFTRHEKIVKLTDYVESHSKDELFVFRIVNCVAARVLVPKERPFGRSLVLWIASPHDEGEANVDTLCLLEDCRKDDDHGLGNSELSRLTSWSVLCELLDEVRGESSHSESLGVTVEFEKDPLSFLSKRGAQVSARRPIRSMYRRRASTGIQQWQTEHKYNFYSVTVGYPIWIVDDSN
jgi:hypothetical protein